MNTPKVAIDEDDDDIGALIYQHAQSDAAKAAALAVDPPRRSGRVKRTAVYAFPFVSSTTNPSKKRSTSEMAGVKLEDANGAEIRSDSSFGSERSKSANAVEAESSDSDSVETTSVSKSTKRTSPSFDALWDKNFKDLNAYKSKHGHFNIDPKQHTLYNWVKTQRRNYKDRKLKQSRLKQLKAIGFDLTLNMKNSAWDENFKDMKWYKSKHGHCNVTREHPALYNWVQSQRWLYKKGELKQSRLNQLNAIGFEFALRATKSEDWETKVAQLKAFKAKHGHTNVTYANDGKTSKLAAWVLRTRIQYREGKVKEWKIAQLKKLGVEFMEVEQKNVRQSQLDDVWNAKLEQLKAFKRKHGHCIVSVKEDPVLGHWVLHQRGHYRRGEMKQERITAMKEMGFDFDRGDYRQVIRDEQWDMKFQALKKFKKKHGHCNVSQRNEGCGVLYFWAKKQRKKFKDGKLSEKRVELLEEIGFEFKK